MRKVLLGALVLIAMVTAHGAVWSEEGESNEYQPSVDRLKTGDFEPKRKPKPVEKKPKAEPKKPVEPAPAAQPAEEVPVTASRVPGEAWREPFTGMEFVWVAGGCFKMGCGPWTGGCTDDEKPVHEVCVDGFWMGKYEVTQGQWQKVTGSNPSQFNKGDDYPVDWVSWDDAKEFIRKLESRSRGGFHLRLPTEAEWEYACRSGGRPQKFAGGYDLNHLAWYRANSGRSSHPVGSLRANALGLHDMSGNLWEWCEDTYDETAYSKHQRDNPLYMGGGSDRVIRGGCWFKGPGRVRCASRSGQPPKHHGVCLGFRLVRSR